MLVSSDKLAEGAGKSVTNDANNFFSFMEDDDSVSD